MPNIKKKATTTKSGSLPSFYAFDLAISTTTKYLHTNILRDDGINNPKMPILCHQCMFYNDSTAWNCIKCNHVTTGNKLNAVTKCKDEGRNLSCTLLGAVGSYHADICMHPLCTDYYGMPPGAYAEGGHEGRQPVMPMALATAMHDANGDQLRVQNTTQRLATRPTPPRKWSRVLAPNQAGSSPKIGST